MADDQGRDDCFAIQNITLYSIQYLYSMIRSLFLPSVFWHCWLGDR